MDTLTVAFQQLQTDYSATLSSPEIRDALLSHIRDPRTKRAAIKRLKPRAKRSWRYQICWIIVPVVLAAIGYAAYLFKTDREYVMYTISPWMQSYPCLLETNMFVREVTRPGFNCSVCEGLEEIPVVDNITPEEFAQKYAYTGVPVLVRGATENWSAVGAFTFDYFKAIYTKQALHSTKEHCQFFAYNTEFSSLEEALEMDKERALFRPGQKPWWVHTLFK